MFRPSFLAFFTLAAVGANDSASDDYDQVSRFNDQIESFNISALPTFTYTFDSQHSAGVRGTINVKYSGPSSTVATITINLDFTNVNQTEIMAFDDNCTEDVTAYKWHIHVKWLNSNDSESFEQCGLAVTGNHYDPLKVCGPNSEFAGTNECLLRTPKYACNPNTYDRSPLACEKGDLSGKFGDLTLDENKRVSGEYHDFNYPLPEENTAEWNMILHAVCGKATPRIACAVGRQTLI